MTTLTQAQLFINGELRGAVSGKTFDVISPWTDAPVNTAAPMATPRRTGKFDRQ